MGNAILAMASTASSGVLMLAVAFIAASRLSLIEQGYFFTFLSFGTLIQLADFGLSYASMQTASHFIGTNRHSELPSFASFSFRLNILFSSTATLIIAIIGIAVFSSRISNLDTSTIDWVFPWTWFIASIFANQLTVPAIALREGSGKIKQVWRLRLIQEWFSAGLCLLALMLGFGLISLALMWIGRFIVASIWLLLVDRIVWDQSVKPYSMRQWMTEVWPFQWKIGLSMLSGYLIFRFFTPVILLEKGPVLAGQFGMVIAMMNMSIAFTSAWPMSQAARYGMLIASSRFIELRNHFPIMLGASTALAIVVAAGFSATFWVINAMGLGFAARLTEPATTAIVLATAIAHHVTACFAMPLRAERREPFLFVSVLGGIVTAVAVWLAAHYGTAQDIALTNFICAFSGVPIAYYLFQSRNHVWTKLYVQ